MITWIPPLWDNKVYLDLESGVKVCNLHSILYRHCTLKLLVGQGRSRIVVHVTLNLSRTHKHTLSSLEINNQSIPRKYIRLYHMFIDDTETAQYLIFTMNEIGKQHKLLLSEAEMMVTHCNSLWKFLLDSVVVTHRKQFTNM